MDLEGLEGFLGTFRDLKGVQEFLRIFRDFKLFLVILSDFERF